ncbi:muramoyltetrapeptide carboxypeptidase [Glaciimonas immobilis]|uniref:Muramoyltetrapeptide carboxypeptidase n=1 Tax=Glaciimonas immobilis TaxID=728004 RepID=A0A840RNQ7_9BURK|nr:muramoyltetrapeptide carboxypeptidase [Glaciimonas immobilis]KAF3999577.1 muramoyltetrapeptide carboxypeptidase [Glaciimonas immobilis]MBB5198568.1 muramoyltetrapeptide carboxypeptidase [Glaciimonas immobilis]
MLSPSEHTAFSKKIGVALIAPGGYPLDEQVLGRGILALQQQGCVVYNYYDGATKYQRFGGTDAGRVAQIVAAIENPQVQVVMAMRGSYGMSRLLPLLDFERITASKKIFVGHSDFTAFQLALLAQTGFPSFAGPMLCSDFGDATLSEFTISHFWQSLRQPEQTLEVVASGNPEVSVEGMLWGGNLAMINHLIGTPYFPQIEDGILFIEDIGEHPYRIERMMLQLQYAGILDRQRAIVMGKFSQYQLAEHDNGYDFDAMLAYLRSHISVPILTGLPFGHIRDKLTLPVGGHAKLVSGFDGFQLHLSGTLVLS